MTGELLSARTNEEGPVAFPIMKLAAALMFACPSPVPVAPAGTALLQSGEIRFHTINEAKDADTIVTVTVRDRRGQTIALLTGVGGGGGGGGRGGAGTPV
ncbi:hypothetical protein AB0F17_64760, partial [Nonomuraea sp. NPDC026600]|uniref:hypothetical protein n=1 Tax=Nonomuraea sp. NPDC026600 TaxID=3155363 RepID=UPI0033F1C945